MFELLVSVSMMPTWRQIRQPLLNEPTYAPPVTLRMNESEGVKALWPIRHDPRYFPDSPLDSPNKTLPVEPYELSQHSQPEVNICPVVPECPKVQSIHRR